MSDKKKNQGQSGGVNITGGNVSAGRDIVGGDVVGRDKITMGDVNIRASFTQWQAQTKEQIDAQPNLSSGVKEDLKDNVAKIQTEAMKGAQADTGRLEGLINTLAVMGPDIFDVAITTLGNPLAGIGLVVKKIADKARVERA